jgi:hypothetical protein
MVTDSFDDAMPYPNLFFRSIIHIDGHSRAAAWRAAGPDDGWPSLGPGQS